MGRDTAAYTIARRNGDHEKADALAPPSERKLTDAEKCGARTQSGKICQKRKGAGTEHPGYGGCLHHGGMTPAGIKSAMREMGRDLANKYKASRKFGGDRTDPSLVSLTPEQALLEEVRRSAAFVRFLEERIGAWNLTPVAEEVIEEYASRGYKARERDPSLSVKIEEVLNDLDAENPDSPAYLPTLTNVNAATGLTNFTDAREWLYLYREERAHLARVSKMCIDAGVASRLVSLAEDQGRILATAIRAVLQALHLTPDQAARVPEIVPPILRAVANDSPIPDISSMARAELNSAASLP